jgi:uncharacterized protein
MTLPFTRCTEATDEPATPPRPIGRRYALTLSVSAMLLVCCFMQMAGANADPLARANAAYARGDYVQVVNILTPLALRGSPRAQAFLGFMFEHGYGAPQAYVAATDLY